MDAALLQTLVTAAAGLLIFVGVGGVSFVLLRQGAMTAQRRLRLGGQAVRQASDPAPGVLSHVIQNAGAIGTRMAARDPEQMSALRLRLTRSGFLGRDAVAVYLGARVAALMLATIGALVFLPWVVLKGGNLGALILVATLALGAMLGPDDYVNRRRNLRIMEYRDGFPDILDLLVASVEAGLSLDAAVGRVADEMARRHPNLAEQLRVLTLELRAGKPRKQAWSALADRLGIDEARSFATMLRQAEEMGTSLGETLTVFSAEMRTKRMLRVEERAMALPAKLMVPLILFIFPCLMGVLLLPAAVRTARLMNAL